MKHDDDLLDKIIVHLRSQPGPEMPADLVTCSTVKTRVWVWYAVAAATLAASLAGFMLWRWQPSPTLDPRSRDVVQQPRTNAHETDVVVLDVDLTEPLQQLESRLDLVDAEIAELRKKASLLDARRLADELLVHHY